MNETATLETLSERIGRMQDSVLRACDRSRRDPADLTVIAVSKTVDRATVDLAYRFGMRHFGENRVQDARKKFEPPRPEDATLHMIGHLQSNKATAATRLFDVIHSVDRPSLIEALAKSGERESLPLEVLLQVNVAREPQKAGCSPEDVQGLARIIQDSENLHLVGLMTMAPLVDDPEAVRPVFADLRCLAKRLAEQLHLDQEPWLSMGMTNDFEVAIDEGATHLRIGRAIFGS
jgi:PLP dependent protein